MMLRWAVVALITLAGCSPKDSDRCARKFDEVCVDEGRALVCDAAELRRGVHNDLRRACTTRPLGHGRELARHVL